MADLGGLCVWAALPLALLAATACLGAACTARGGLARLGGRAAEATAVLSLIALVGLGHALLSVQLKYAYVATYSGFQETWPWRLAALWSGPGGATLTLSWLVVLAAAVSYRLDRSRQAAARTGCLTTLGLLGLLIVTVGVRPFTQTAVPGFFGSGLPVTAKQLSWQLEVWATHLATACAVFAFAGVMGAQLSGSALADHSERVAVGVAAGLLTVAALAAAWRVYSAGGRLLDSASLSSIAVHAPAALLAYAHLHAPGGLAVPGWAARWRRVLAVALFPAALGDDIALLAGMGTAPPAFLWAGGLAVGILAGATAGLGRQQWTVEALRTVPGYGPYAILGGLSALGFAALVAVWALLRSEFWAYLVWPLVLLGLAAVAAWSVARPAAGWRRVWPVAAALAAAGVVSAYGLHGWRAPTFAIAAGLAAAVLVGVAADVVRLAAARRWQPSAVSGGMARAEDLARARARRRRASVVGHLGAALVVLGLAAEALTLVETRVLEPGDTLALSGGLGGELRVTYLGLSRYHVGELEKRVASLSFERGKAAPRLVTASVSFDRASRREFPAPALERGAFHDIIIGIAEFAAGDRLWCRIAARPLTAAVWLGGLLLLLASLLGCGRPRW